MNRKLFLFSFLILTQFYSKIVAQNMGLDIAIVGDSIDYEEKVKYILFETIPNNDYYFSIITKRNSDTLITHYKKSDTIEIKVNYEYITAMSNNIIKLNTYYNSINKAPEISIDSLKTSILKAKSTSIDPRNIMRGKTFERVRFGEYKDNTAETEKTIKPYITPPPTPPPTYMPPNNFIPPNY